MKLEKTIAANIAVVLIFLIVGYMVSPDSALTIMMMATASLPLSVLTVYLKNKYLYETENKMERIVLQVALTNGVTEAILFLYLVLR